MIRHVALAGERSTLGQLIRFGAVGCVNTGLGLAFIFAVRYGLGTSDLVANFVGYAIGIVVSFILNRRITFRDRGPITQTFARFLMVAAVSYAINVVVLILCLDALRLPSVTSQLIAVLAYSASFFVLAKLFAFKAAKRDAVAAPPS